MGQRSNDEPARRSVEEPGPDKGDDDRSLIARHWIGLVSADGRWRWDGQRWEPNTADPDGTPSHSGNASAQKHAPSTREVTTSDLDDWLREPWTTRTSREGPRQPPAQERTPATDDPSETSPPTTPPEAGPIGRHDTPAEPAREDERAGPPGIEGPAAAAEAAAESGHPQPGEPDAPPGPAAEREGEEADAPGAPPAPAPRDEPADRQGPAGTGWPEPQAAEPAPRGEPAGPDDRAAEPAAGGEPAPRDVPADGEEPADTGWPDPHGAEPDDRAGAEPARIEWRDRAAAEPAAGTEPAGPDEPARSRGPIEWPDSIAAASEVPTADGPTAPSEPEETAWADPAQAEPAPASDPVEMGGTELSQPSDEPAGPAEAAEAGWTDPVAREGDPRLLRPADQPDPPPDPAEEAWSHDDRPEPSAGDRALTRTSDDQRGAEDRSPPPEDAAAAPGGVHQPANPPPAAPPRGSQEGRFGPSRPPEPGRALHTPGEPSRPPAPLRTYSDDDVQMSASAISTDRQLRPGEPVQEVRGFRAMLQRLLSSRGRSRLEEEERHRQLMALCRTRVPGCRRIAVISRKGGIGKTTTALMLGHQFANLRDDRVLALDANPDAGSLGDRVPSETRGTVTDILHDADRLHDYSDLRPLTARAQSGLEVVASDNDPRITEALGEEDYRRVLTVLANHYSVLVCDTGTGILDSATRGLLNQADQIVLCATQSVDASRVSALTLDWMDQNGYEHLVRDAVVSINAVHTGLADIDRLQAYFERRCRAVVRIPWDMRLALGAETTLEELQPATQAAYLNLAAMVAAGFAR